MAGDPIFGVRLEEFGVRFNYGSASANAAASKEYMNKLTETYGRKLAEYAKKRFSDALSANGKYKIGASEESAHNFVVSKVSNAGGLTSWAIFEGTKGANQLIRTGIKAGSSKPSIRTLRMWAAEKGLSLYSKEDEKKARAENLTFSKVKTKTGKTYARSRGRKARADDALFRIRAAMIHTGTNRPSANWYKAYPSGVGRFDYVAHVLRSHDSFLQMLERMGSAVSTAYIDWLGKTKMNFRTFNL